MNKFLNFRNVNWKANKREYVSALITIVIINYNCIVIYMNVHFTRSTFF